MNLILRLIIQQFSYIEIHLLKLVREANILPELLGFLQLSLYKRSAITDFHLLGRSASSCISGLSLENNRQTMQTLTWKAFFFFWSGKWFLAARREWLHRLSHVAPNHDNTNKEESCAVPHSNLWGNAFTRLTLPSLKLLNRVLHIILNVASKSGYKGIHLNSCLIHPKCSIWLQPSDPRLSGTALHMANISHWCAGVPQMLLSYGCLAAA